MKFKKVITLFLLVVIFSVVYTIYNFSGFKNIFADSIKKNVVYKNYLYRSNYKEAGSIQSECLKSKVEKVLKKCFNISAKSLEQRHKAESSLIVINKRTVTSNRKQQIDEANELFREGYYNIEQFKKRREQIKKSYSDYMKIITKLGHGSIQYVLMNNEKDKIKIKVMAFINEATREVEVVHTIKDDNKKSVGITREEAKKIGENFIIKYKLGGIKKCKFLRFGLDVYSIWYADRNDESKKAFISIDPANNKVSSFSIKSYAKFYYYK